MQAALDTLIDLHEEEGKLAPIPRSEWWAGFMASMGGYMAGSVGGEKSREILKDIQHVADLHDFGEREG